MVAQENQKEIITEIRILFYRNKRKDAESKLRKVLDKNNNALLNGWLALILAYDDQYDQALTFADRALNLDSNIDIAYVAKGIVAKGKEDYSSAKIELERAIQKDNCSALGHTWLTYLKRDTDSPETALEFISQFISKNCGSPHLCYAYLCRGQIIYKVYPDNFSLSQADFKKAIELNPDFVLAHYVLGLTYDSQKDWSSALESYDKALELNPKHSSSLFERARVKRIVGDLEGSLDDIISAVELVPDNALYWLLKGNVEYELEDHQAASRSYNKTIELNPLDATSWYRRSIIKREQGHYKNAISDLDRAIKIDSTSMTFFCHRGLAKSNLNDYHGAIEDYSKAIALEPNDYWAWSARGELKRYLKDYSGAIKDLSQALYLNPNDSESLSARASSYEAIQDQENALLDRAGLYQIVDKPALVFKNADSQYLHDRARSHFQTNLSEEIKRDGRRFVEYYECFLTWGRDTWQSLQKGTSYSVHNLGVFAYSPKKVYSSVI